MVDSYHPFWWWCGCIYVPLVGRMFLTRVSFAAGKRRETLHRHSVRLGLAQWRGGKAKLFFKKRNRSLAHGLCLKSCACRFRWPFFFACFLLLLFLLLSFLFLFICCIGESLDFGQLRVWLRVSVVFCECGQTLIALETTIGQNLGVNVLGPTGSQIRHKVWWGLKMMSDGLDLTELCFSK